MLFKSNGTAPRRLQYLSRIRRKRGIGSKFWMTFEIQIQFIRIAFREGKYSDTFCCEAIKGGSHLVD